MVYIAKQKCYNMLSSVCDNGQNHVLSKMLHRTRPTGPQGPRPTAVFVGQGVRPVSNLEVLARQARATIGKMVVKTCWNVLYNSFGSYNFVI